MSNRYLLHIPHNTVILTPYHLIFDVTGGGKARARALWRGRRKVPEFAGGTALRELHFATTLGTAWALGAMLLEAEHACRKNCIIRPLWIDGCKQGTSRGGFPYHTALEDKPAGWSPLGCGQDHYPRLPD